jgi:DNA modification methylase
MPGQVVENPLWAYTEPGDIVFDPFHRWKTHVSKND